MAHNKGSFANKLVILFLTALLAIGYLINYDFSNKSFLTFQWDSQALVEDAIYAAQNGTSLDGYGLANRERLTVYTDAASEETTSETATAGSDDASQPLICFTENSYYTDKLVPGAMLVFPGGEKRTITAVSVNDTIFEVHYEGDAVVLPEDGGRFSLEAADGTPVLDSVTSYQSQVGLQGRIFILLSKLLPQAAVVPVLEGLCALLMAIVAICLVWLLRLKYSTLFAGCFYITFLLSPWIVNFARNLFWVEFTWFVPMLIGLYASLRGKRLWPYCLLAFGSIFLKSLCGYEYISTIMVGLVLFPCIDWLAEPDHTRRRKLFGNILGLGLCALAGFCAALLLHAGIRGSGNLLEGLKDIYLVDIRRRTFAFGDSPTFSANINASLEASVVMVVAYYTRFSTSVIAGIDGGLFLPLCVICAAVLVLALLKKYPLEKFILPFFCLSLLAPLSWFILAKAHSYCHMHMNYVLWYFGFVQILLYILLRSVQVLLTGNSPANKLGSVKKKV